MTFCKYFPFPNFHLSLLSNRKILFSFLKFRKFADMASQIRCIIVILSLFLFFHKCRSQCHNQEYPDSPNRTVCILPKGTEGRPLQFEIKEPQYVYIRMGEGEIPENIFEEVHPTIELWFMGVNISRIQPGAFEQLDVLNILAVTETGIQTLSRHTFRGLRQLKTLALNNNQINSIQDGAFLGLENLDQVILNDNRITKLGENTFDGLKSLKGLFLMNNPIEYIHDLALHNMEDLSHLNISIVQGKDISEKALQLPKVFQLKVFYVQE